MGEGPPSRTVLPRVRSDLTRSVFSTIIRIYRIGNLHGVTIRRELIHSDQINQSEHGETDRLRKYAFSDPRKRARLAEDCDDRRLAERLKTMAADLLAKAEDFEELPSQRATYQDQKCFSLS